MINWRVATTLWINEGTERDWNAKTKSYLFTLLARLLLTRSPLDVLGAIDKQVIAIIDLHYVHVNWHHWHTLTLSYWHYQ